MKDYKVIMKDYKVIMKDYKVIMKMDIDIIYEVFVNNV